MIPAAATRFDSSALMSYFSYTVMTRIGTQLVTRPTVKKVCSSFPRSEPR